MKKFFFLACLLLSATMTFAQTSKKVAILEVVDKEGRLSYPQKLMLRSNMGKAVANTPGYEAYDRSDVDAIMSEQDFQRTGMVSNKEIKQLGEMTGVSFILVTEGALTNDNKIFVTVKLLNVETAKVEIVENNIMGLGSADMQKGCEQLASALFGKGGSTTHTKSSSSATKAVGAGSVVRVSSKEYTCNGQSMNKREYEYFLRNNCTAAYAQFKSGRKMVSGGWASAIIGLAFIVSGATCMALENAVTAGDSYDSSSSNSYEYSKSEYSSSTSYSSSSDYSSEGTGILYSMGAAFVTVGALGVGTSVPLLALGYVRQKKSVNTYNAQCAYKKAVSFNMIGGTNGIGLAMQF